MGNSFSQIVEYCSDPLTLTELCNYKTMGPREKKIMNSRQRQAGQTETRSVTLHVVLRPFLAAPHTLGIWGDTLTRLFSCLS